MAIESLSDFETTSFLPHVIVYAVYAAVKYTLILTELAVHYLSRHHHSVGRVANSDIVHISFFLLTLLVSCFCCCCCCGRKCGTISYLFDKTRILSAKFIHFLVNTLFGADEGFVNRYLKPSKAKKAKRSVPKLYIRNMELGHNEVSHLALIIFTFLLLAGITSWDVFFLEETHVCSENPNISCFPILNLKDNVTSEVMTTFDFSKIHQQPITNCSFWNSEDVSNQVAFLCFRWIFNSKAATSAIGGLLTIFVLTVKIFTAALIAFNEVVIEKVTLWNGEWINMCSYFRFRIGECLKAVRLTIVVLVACVELTFALLVCIGYTKVQERHTNFLFMFYRNLGNQIMLSFGLLSILLLLPFEKYATSESSHIDVPSSGESEEGEDDLNHQLSTEDV